MVTQMWLPIHYYSWLPVDASRRRHVPEALVVVVQLGYRVHHIASVQLMNSAQMRIQRLPHRLQWRLMMIARLIVNTKLLRRKSRRTPETVTRF